jgi:O-antigen/teichoic acid export membrane protein
MITSADEDVQSHPAPSLSGGRGDDRTLTPGAALTGRLLVRNTGFNLVGVGVMFLLALFAIPLLLGGLGAQRFGILALAWGAVGYFTLFNLGLGRALTQMLAARSAAGRNQEIPSLVWTALLLILALGVLAALVLMAAAPPLLDRGLRVPPELRSEAHSAFRILALGLPFVVSAAGLVGVLEARQRFGTINSVVIPTSVATYLGPVLVLQFTNSLVPVVALLVASRAAAWLAYLVLTVREIPSLLSGVRFDAKLVPSLFRLGGWMTISNVVSPIMVYLDRFLIGALLSMAGVAYYVASQEVVLKLGAIPSAAVAVLFPGFASGYGRDNAKLASLVGRGLRMMILLLFPIVLVVVTFAGEGLTLWLGEEFAANGTGILQWLAVGLLINGFAQVPSTVVQGIGRPDLNARLHLLELPLYLVLAWVLIVRHGIEGAAMAWVIRVAVDAVALLWIAGRLLPESRGVIRTNTLYLVGALALLTLVSAPAAPAVRAALLVLALCGFALLARHHLLSPTERRALPGLWRATSDAS